MFLCVHKLTTNTISLRWRTQTDKIARNWPRHLYYMYIDNVGNFMFASTRK